MMSDCENTYHRCGNIKHRWLLRNICIGGFLLCYAQTHTMTHNSLANWFVFVPLEINVCSMYVFWELFLFTNAIGVLLNYEN